MSRPSLRVFFAVLFVFATPRCTGDANKRTPTDAAAGDQDSVIAALSTEESAWLSPVFPTATQKRTYAIPNDLLPQEDIDAENTTLWAIYNADMETLGYARDVFTHVACNGACQAIRFILTYDADVTFTSIFHPANTTHDFMKYWQDEYLEFSTADRELLNNILANPPADLTAVTDPQSLVANSTDTAPTVVTYQDDVVRGAAFTTYVALLYRLETPELISTVISP